MRSRNYDFFATEKDALLRQAQATVGDAATSGQPRMSFADALTHSTTVDCLLQLLGHVLVGD